MTTLQTKLIGCACAASLLTGLAPYTAFAQSSEDASVKDELIVTGSRIKRGNAESAVPLQIMDASELGEVGTTDLAEALVQLPGVSESISQRNSNNFIQTSGLSTISLRRLGDDRTLVLINGRRAVSNSGNSDRVSLSTLPSGFVERTEITTGGASAIYGSDAIAGVANFKLEDDYEGVQLDARYTAPEASGGDEIRVNLKYGTEFADKRGYIFLAGSYRDVEMIRADSTRPGSILAIEFDDPATSSRDTFTNELSTPGCDPVNVERHCFLPSFSGSTPGGVFESGDAWFVNGQWFNDGSLQPDDRSGSQDFFTDYDGWNFRPGRTLIGSRELYNFGLHSTYDFSNTLRGTFTAMYSDIKSSTTSGYETLNDDDEFGLLDAFEVGDMSSRHPFIPPEVEETRSSGVGFDRRLIELGEQSRENDRKTIRLIGDLTGELSNGFEWEAFATYGHFKQVQDNPNEVNFLKAQYALDIEEDGVGGYQCADADARADGCVPLNLFGEGSITPAMADYIRYNGHASQTRTQYSAGGLVRGDAFELPAGAIKFAVGAEFRREEQNTNGDPDGDFVGGVDGDPNTLDFNVTSLSTFPDLKASYDVVEGFAEVDVPVFDTLNLQAAARVANYNTIGTIFSYNAGAVWQPIDSLKIRGQYSRAQRAPNLSEFFSLPRPDSDDLIDPCEGLLADGTGLRQPSGATNPDGTADLSVVAANCLSQPGIQQYFIDNPGEEFEAPTSVQGPNSGNPDLKAETANTYTIGAIFQPSFIPRLTLIVDYYQIDIADAITSIETQDVVSLCYASADFPNNRFCDVITRNRSNGIVTEVINYQENLDEENVAGIDATLKYDFEVGVVPGDFDIDLRYSHYLKDETSFKDLAGNTVTPSRLGEIGTPEDEFRAKLGWKHNGVRLSYTMTFAQGGVDDIIGAPDPSDDHYFAAGDEFWHRVYASYTFGDDDQYRIYGGVNNIGNNFGPLMVSGLNNGSSLNLTSDLNDPTGREFYVGMRVDF